MCEYNVIHTVHSSLYWVAMWTRCYMLSKNVLLICLWREQEGKISNLSNSCINQLLIVYIYIYVTYISFLTSVYGDVIEKYQRHQNLNTQHMNIVFNLHPVLMSNKNSNNRTGLPQNNLWTLRWLLFSFFVWMKMLSVSKTHTD